MRTKTVKFGEFDVVFIQMPSKIWITPTRVIGMLLGYTANGQKLSDHISGKWSDEFEKDDKVILDALHLSEIRKYVPDFEAGFASSMSFLTLKGVMKVILKSRSEVAEKFREELIAQIPDVVPNQPEESMSEKTETKAVVAAPASTKAAPKTNSKKYPPIVNKVAPRLPKAKQLTLDISSKGDTALDALMKTLEFGKKWNVFSKADIRATLTSIRDTQLERFKQEALLNAGTASGRVSYKDATQMVPVSNIQASTLTPNFDSVRSFFLTGHQKHVDFINYMSAEEIGKVINKTSDQMKDPIKKYVNSLGHDLPNNMVTKAVIEAGGYFKGIASLMDKHNLPVVNIPNVGMATWYMMEDGKIIWRNYWHPSVVEGVMSSLGFPTVSELPDPEQFREHNPSTK